MDVDGGVELRTALVQVDDGLYGQGSGALGSVEGEVPPLAAGVLTLEPEGAAEEDPEGAVGAQLGEGAVLQHRRAAVQLGSPGASGGTGRRHLEEHVYSWRVFHPLERFIG